MATQKAKKVAETVENGLNPFMDGVHKILLAGIGAVSLAQEEIEEFVNRLIEKGEIAEKDGRKMIDDIAKRRKKETQKAEKEFEKRTEELLSRFNIPSKSDIDALNTKIAALTKKIDELKK